MRLRGDRFEPYDDRGKIWRSVSGDFGWQCSDKNVFYKETGRLEIKRQFYRIPCVYDWNNGSKLLDRVFLEALSAVISKPCRKQVKGGEGAGRKYIISKNK